MICRGHCSYTYNPRVDAISVNAERHRANTKDEDPTGLLNEGLRYRDLAAGVFISRDPAGFVDGPNVYTYVRQNPWSAFDPDGLFMQVVGDWLGERWQAPSAVRSMANHTATVVNTTQTTLAVASMVPVLGKGRRWSFSRYFYSGRQIRRSGDDGGWWIAW